MEKPGLQSFLNTADTSLFLKNYWPGKFFHADGPPERLNGLINYRFEDLLKMDRGQTRAYRVTNGRTIRLRINRGQEAALYESGFTIYFIDLRFPAFDTWLRAMEADLGLVPGATRISAFASRQGDGLSTHFDGNDNFICHAQGTKRWRVSENPDVTYPNCGYVIGEKMLPENYLEAPGGYPQEPPTEFQTVELSPGSIMFMPRGVWHSTETLGGESLHFNIRAALPIWRELVEFSLKNSGGEIFDELRAPVMPLFQGDQLVPGLEEELRKKIGQLADAICAAENPLLFDHLMETLVRSRKV